MALLLAVRDPSTPWLLYLYAGLFGAGVGLIGPTTTAATADLFQGKGFGGINGFIVMGFGPGGALGPWLGGLIYDASGSYTPAFVLVIVSALMACAAVWLAAPRKVRLVPGQVARWRHEIVSV
jgi:MFS family permease